MTKYTLTHVRDDVLLRDLSALVARDRFTTAMLLAYVAEIDGRKLYRAAAYPSMFAYCTEHLHLSENAAYRRITSARAARRFPALFSAIAEGQLHLSAVCLLAPHLTQENLDELIKAATHQGKKEVESMLARRFAATYPFAMVPPPVPAKIRPLPVRSYTPQLVPGRVPVKTLPLLDMVENSPGQVTNAAAHVRSESPCPVASESTQQAESSSQGGSQETASPAERYLVQFTIEKSDRDLLQHAQALLSHAAPSADLSEVFLRALRFYVKHLEKQKFAALTRNTGKARKAVAPNAEARTEVNHVSERGKASNLRSKIPAHVRRAVWERDQGQCTFVGPDGKRCGARKFLEFDHVDPVARGGRPTVERMRLRCRDHNQFEAERTCGPEFMKAKRERRVRRATLTAT